ncbi:MAG: FAD-dependent oxidoreductase, partial [Actinobacteria bacterium]|nr:FAD-dependent oxidoreductase [Actinomycetota bacterium]
WRCAQQGMTVTLLERHELGAGATHVAAGMLGPVAEAGFGPAAGRLLDLGLASARRWPDFAAELAAASETQSRLRSDGTLIVARDADEAVALERELAFRADLGLDVARLRPTEARRLEPALAPTLRMAVSVPSEQTVDPRWVLDALARAARGAGVELREHARVTGLVGRPTPRRGVGRPNVREGRHGGPGGRIDGVCVDHTETVLGASTIICAGAWSGPLGAAGVRPVKGQIMRLRDPAGPGLLGRVVRFGGGYLVPRGDGDYVLGATVEERGFDRTVTAGAIHQLLRDAAELVPGVLELSLVETAAGLRPGTPDNLPLIGPADREGLFWATGHYRNGILLAPLTAELLVGALAGALVG